MGLEEILSGIEENAREEVSTVEREGRESAEAKRTSWRARGEREKEGIVARGEREAERVLQRAGAEGRLAAGKELLVRKRHWLDRVSGAALDRLLGEEAGLYRKMLEVILARCEKEGVTGVRFSGDAVTRSVAETWLGGRGDGAPEATFAGEDEPPRGGLVAVGRSVSTDLSLSRLVEEIADRQQGSLHRILFGAVDE